MSFSLFNPPSNVQNEVAKQKPPRSLARLRRLAIFDQDGNLITRRRIFQPPLGYAIEAPDGIIPCIHVDYGLEEELRWAEHENMDANNEIDEIYWSTQFYTTRDYGEDSYRLHGQRYLYETTDDYLEQLYKDV